VARVRAQEARHASSFPPARDIGETVLGHQRELLAELPLTAGSPALGPSAIMAAQPSQQSPLVSGSAQEMAARAAAAAAAANAAAVASVGGGGPRRRTTMDGAARPRTSAPFSSDLGSVAEGPHRAVLSDETPRRHASEARGSSRPLASLSEAATLGAQGA
jgi:hypothetical protein